MPTKPVIDLSLDIDTEPNQDVTNPPIPESLITSVGTDAITSETDYTITLDLYPGVEIPIEDTVPFMCRDAKFELTSSSSQLGLILRGPSGADIASTFTPDGGTYSIEVPELGQGDYTVTAVNVGPDSSAIDVSIKYSWHQTMYEKEGKGLMSATVGSVFASTKNVPLLYTSTNSIPSNTVDALNLLGVKKVYLVDLGDFGTDDLAQKIMKIRSSFQPKLEVEEISHCQELYSRIREETKQNGIYQNDIVFTTINPWTTWKVTEGMGQ